MHLSYFKIGSRTFIQDAKPEFGDQLNLTLDGVCFAIKDDGLNWEETDQYGNTYTKSGNTLTILTNEGNTVTHSINGVERFVVRQKSDGKYYLGISILTTDVGHGSFAIGSGVHYHYRSFIDDASGQALDISNYYSWWNATTPTDWYNSSNIILGEDNLYYAEYVVKYTGEAYDENTVVNIYDAFIEVTSWLDIPFGKPDERDVYDDPYDDGGTSGDGGGDGDFDDDSDDIDFPTDPTLQAGNTGFVTLFNPSLAQLRSLSSYMWSSSFDESTFKKLFANPMDCILGLSILPCSIPNAGTKEVKVGNLGTGVSMTYTNSQYVTVDCGTLSVSEYWGGYLDYDSYTKVDIYLPYIGTKPLRTDDVMKKTLSLKYKIDILSGACVAMLKCGDSILYSYSGQCSIPVPVTGNDYASMVRGVLSIAATAGVAVASGGLTAPAAVASMASTATNVMTIKPTIQKSNAIGGGAGLIAVQKPYLIIQRPKQCLPENQISFTGYPTYTSGKISNYTGFCRVKEIHLENVSGTQAEKDEIVRLLKEGVIV